MRGKQSAYIYPFIVTMALFGATNIIDQLLGQSQNTKSYPFFIFLVWTAAVATFLYFGWKQIFIVNGSLLYLVQIYSLIYHKPLDNPTQLEWLIGTLPFENSYMISIPVVFLCSLIYQFIIYRIELKRSEFVNVVDDEDDDYEEEPLQQ